MVLANLRERLTTADIELVVRVLSRGDEDRRAALLARAGEQGVEVLLDAPELVERLRRLPSLTTPSPALFIYVVVRSALRAVGIDDARLSDYVGALLLGFGLRDRAYRIAEYDDELYRYLVDIVADVEAASGRRAFLLRAHLGNYSLWLAGLFPDYVLALRERKGGPALDYYEEMGARGFRLARSTTWRGGSTSWRSTRGPPICSRSCVSP